MPIYEADTVERIARAYERAVTRHVHEQAPLCQGDTLLSVVDVGANMHLETYIHLFGSPGDVLLFIGERHAARPPHDDYTARPIGPLAVRPKSTLVQAVAMLQ